MPFFMTLSGMTFYISDKHDSMNVLIKKKAKRLLFPFFYTTLFIVVPIKYCCGYWNDSDHPIIDIFLGQFLLFGGSHLWFIVSLFIITIAFAALNKCIKYRGVIFWIITIIISYTGLTIEKFGYFLGIPGALKYFAFFALGYYYFEKINNLKIANPIMIIVSWTVMSCVYILMLKINGHMVQYSFIPMAFWGSINMIVLCKAIIDHTKIQNNKIFNSLKNNSYNLYLFSEPFNYIFISVIAISIGSEVLIFDKISIIAFITRFLTTLLGAYIIIWSIRIMHRIINIFSNNIKTIVSVQK